MRRGGARYNSSVLGLFVGFKPSQFCSEGEKVSGMPSVRLSFSSPPRLAQASPLPPPSFLDLTLHCLLAGGGGGRMRPGHWKNGDRYNSLGHHTLPESSTGSVGPSEVEYNMLTQVNSTETPPPLHHCQMNSELMRSIRLVL